MALDVASLLDGVSLEKTMLDKAVDGMNKIFASKKVALESPKSCSVMVTIGARSYLFSAQSNGAVQVAVVEGAEAKAKALAKSDARMVIDPVAYNREVGDLGEDWLAALKERRTLYIEGDEVSYVLLHNALVPHVDALQAATPKASMKQDSALAMDMWKGLEPPSLQVANLKADDAQPMLGDKFRGWLLFSATSTMFGNAGQSNYVAANQFMDALSFMTRQCRPTFEATTMMWGTVGHIGMRWKAFASADMIYQGENADDIVMMPAEAMVVLKTIFQGMTPEWFVANKFGKEATEFFASGMAQNGGGPRDLDPWKFKKGKEKGKGGGSSVYDEGSFPEPLQPVAKSSKPSGQQSGKAAHEGRRVRLHRLEANSELNGTKGTLIEELEDGKWIVRVDGGIGDKILKASNLATLTGARLDTGKRCSEAVVLPPADVYIQAA